ncbi:MAG: DUF1549 domain-containing protein [Planctomycetaceae bacterium]
MKFNFTYSFSALLLLPFLCQQVSADEKLDFFEKKIRPILIAKCYECHSQGSAKLEGGLLLDSRKGVLTGGESGPVLIAGNPAESLLLSAIRHESFEMPPDEKLSDEVIADFEHWIETGAIDPRDQPPSPTEAAELAWQAKLAERSRWWSLQPPVSHQPPVAANPEWNKEPVDQFIFAKLSDSGLEPSPDSADAETLLRRLSFVLTGLPPTPEQVVEFQAAYEVNPDEAYTQLVDELQASPHYGERIARHWMDVIRYTDTYGYEDDLPVKGGWEYRDYLIRAFNNDVSFQQLIKEHLAGDLLPEPRINEEDQLNESLIGVTFFNMGEHRGGSSLLFNGIHQDLVDNRIDSLSKGFLAMTVACARCHDHKLDAVSQEDYYALAGIIMSPRWVTRVIDSPDKYADQIDELKQLRAEIREQLIKTWTAQDHSLSPMKLKNWAEEHREDLVNVSEEEVAFPIGQLLKTSEPEIPSAWKILADTWRNKHDERVHQNKEKFEVLTDFTEPGFPEHWGVEGIGIQEGYVTDGSPLISLEGESIVSELLPRGYHTHALSSKLPGAIYLPTQQLFPQKYLSLEFRGGEWGGYQMIPQNTFLEEGPSFFDPEQPSSWTTFGPKELKNGVTRIITQITTSSLNTNFPPRTGIGSMGKVRLDPRDENPFRRSWFSLTGVTTHSSEELPQNELAYFASLYKDESPETVDVAWTTLSVWLNSTIDRWSKSECQDGDLVILNWLLKQGLLPNQFSESSELNQLVQRYREIEALN